MEMENIENKNKTILVVDDEINIVDILACNLKKEGYNVLTANDGAKALDIALKQKPNLILLDVMIPEIDGFNVCRKIKEKIDIPILFISARSEEFDKLLGLDLGADDYITKPFSVREVMARVKNNLRKAEVIKRSIDETKIVEELEENENIIKVGDLNLDLDKYEIHVKGKLIDLSQREFEVLKFLAEHQGKVVTRQDFLEQVWKYEYYGEKELRTVDVTIRRIREKIEEDTAKPHIIVTKRSRGYYIPQQETFRGNKRC